MSEAAAFDALLEEYFPVWLRFHPELAQGVGDYRFADRYRAADDDDIGALSSWLESLMVSLEELDFSALDGDRQLDLQLIFGAAQLEHQCLLEADWRHRDPLGFLPLRRLHHLTQCPPDGLARILEVLLAGLPEYLRHARNQLSAFPGLVSRLSLAAALEESEAGIAFLRAIPTLPRVRSQLRDRTRVQGLAAQASLALAGFFDFLRQDLAPVANGGLGVGPAHYRRWLHQRHFLPEQPDRLRAWVTRVAADTVVRLGELARRLIGKDDLSGLESYLEGINPHAGPTRLEAARALCQSVRELGHRLGWAILPERGLRVAEKTSCLVPGLGEQTYLIDADGAGCLLLPPLPGGEVESEPALFDRCLDAGWLGSHLLESNGLPGRSGLARRLNRSAGLGQGWGIYLRDLLVREAELASPEREAALLLHNLGQFRRALLDVDVHDAELSYEDALVRVGEIPGVGSERAHFELVGICRQPGEALAGAVGGLLIEAARHRLEPELGRRQFHSRLLRQGPVALPLVLRMEFGASLWQELAADAGI
jgi:uncharacterized protein (DUF885 family)